MSPQTPSTSLAGLLTPSLDRIARRRARRGLPPPQILVASATSEFRYGDQGTPFHAASIGKIATAALVLQLVDEGAISLETSVQSLLGPLPGLLRGEASVRDLLAHTSGAADYYDGAVTSGPRFIELITRDPDHDWHPNELLEFSRDHQRPVGAPGERFLYSDTGYTLAGLLLERVTERPLDQLLAERIFAPLGMEHSWLVHRTPGDHPPLAPIWLGRVEVSRFRSVSAGWAGGGIAATLDDLVRLIRGLRSGLVSAPMLAQMSTIQHRVRPGMHYGLGLMELRFDGFSPFLRGMPHLLGHTGSLSTHLYHDPVHDTDIAINFHGSAQMVPSMRTLITIVRAWDRSSAKERSPRPGR